jgi:two-component system, cell cycle response regulator DivK
MDIQIPDMDGLEATRRLCADERTRAIPIVAVSASVQEAERCRTLAAGCVGFISKPIDPTRFGGQVASFITGGASASGGTGTLPGTER